MSLSGVSMNMTFLCQALFFLLVSRVNIDAGQNNELVIVITATLKEKTEFESPCVLLLWPSSYL